MKKPLTPDEENLIKDIIKALSNDSNLNARVRTVVTTRSAGKITKLSWEKSLDSIFSKLQNGRLIAEVI